MSHKERGKSLRDKLAHKRFVQAFVINFTSSGFRLFGGGESLGTQGPSDSRGLTEVLRERL